MEKGYRIVICPGSPAQRCGQKIRLTITKKNYGKEVSVRCPKCDLTFETTIPTPAMRPAGKASDSINEKGPFDFFKTVDDVFGSKK